MRIPHFLLLIAILVPCVARAANEILTPDGVSASSQTDGRGAEHLIDGSGIIGFNGQTTVETSSIHQGNSALGWTSSPDDPDPFLEYVWEEPQDLCGLVLWQGLGTEGVKMFALTAIDASGESLGTWTFEAQEVPIIPGAATDIPPQLFPMGSETMPVSGVERIKLTVLGNHGADVTSLSETHFTKPSDEPVEGEICVVDKRSIARWHVPRDEKDQSNWFLPGFDDGRWNTGPACLGYETGPLCDDLIVYLTMDIARLSGTTVLDTSNSPVVHNGIRVGTVPVVPGQVLEGLRPPGDVNNYVGIQNHPELNPEGGEYSVGIWVFPEEPQAPVGIIAQKDGDNEESGWSIIANTQGSVITLKVAPGVTRQVSMAGLPANQWSHIGFVIDRTGQKLIGYRNGIVGGSEDLLASDVVTNRQPITLLRTPVITDFKYRAGLDEFAVWKRALTSEEIRAAYDAGVAGQGLKTGASGTGGLYAGLIDTNVGNQMFGVNTTIWERIRFNLGSLAGIQAMVLRMHYDDGFICYLNGVEIARRNVPTSAPVFNMAAASDRSDPLALTQEVIDVSAFIDLLVTGENVLAIHAVNDRRDAQRFVIWPELCIDREDCRGRNKGREFWLTFPESYETDPTNPKEISLCFAGAPGTAGLVRMPRLGVSIPFTINATGVAKVVLDVDKAELSGSDVIEDKGIHVTAEKPVCVVGLNHINFSTDAYLGLPTKLLGTEYLVLGYPNEWPGLPTLNGTQFGLVATVDETEVQVVPSVTTDGHPAGVPYYITLSAGQTYQLMNTEDGSGDLSGTEIRANNPVAVFAGHRCANIRGAEFFCDHLVEHLPPVNHWQARYYLGSLATRSGGDTVRVLAAVDNTSVFFNGALVATLNRGEVHDVIVTGPTAVTTNGPPVLVAQYSNSSDFDGVEDADPFMALVPPPEAYDTTYRICSPPTGGFDKNYLNIVLPAGQQGATTVDGVALNVIPGATFAPIPTTGLLSAVVPVSAGVPHDVLGASPIGVIAYGFASYNFDSYGFPAGVSYERLPPQIGTPLEQTVYADGTSGTAAAPNIQGGSTVNDPCDPRGSFQLSQTPRIDSRLEPGTYLVTVSATNAAGLTGTATMILRVELPWPARYFPDEYGNPDTEATIWGCFADPDKDGDSNQKEWLFGGDPTDPLSRAVIELVQGPATAGDGSTEGLRLRYHRRFQDPAASYEEQGGSDLETWYTGPGVIRTVSSQLLLPGGEYEEVLIEAEPTSVMPPPLRYFLRIIGDGCPP